MRKKKLIFYEIMSVIPLNIVIQLVLRVHNIMDIIILYLDIIFKRFVALPTRIIFCTALKKKNINNVT